MGKENRRQKRSTKRFMGSKGKEEKQLLKAKVMLLVLEIQKNTACERYATCRVVWGMLS